MIGKLKKTSLFVSSALACSSFGYANTSDSSTSSSSGSDANTANPPASLNDKELLSKLQQQVQQLQGQLKHIKAKKSSNNARLKNTSANNSKFSTYNSKVGSSDTRTVSSGLDFSGAVAGGTDPNDITKNINEDSSVINLEQEPSSGLLNQGGGIDVGNAPAITTGGEVSFLGSFSGNNSIPIGQISSNLFASTILGQREKFDDYAVFFGGFLEADAHAWFGNRLSRSAPGKNGKSQSINPFHGNGQNIYLTASNLYFLSNLGHYVTAQFDFDTDETGEFGLGNAFVMFGNLDTSPFFVTAGRNKLSVGAYGGGGTITKGLSNVFAPGQVTNLSVNYKNDVLNANISVFGSDDKTANFSAGIFYADSITENVAVGLNTGYVFNMAGAGNQYFNQVLTNTDSEGDNVGVFNIDANIAYTGFGGIWQLQSGWSTTSRKEKFNGDGHSVSGSTPSDGSSALGSDVLAGVWYSAVNYSALLAGRNTNFGVSYGQTYNAAAIPMDVAASPINFGFSDSGVHHQFVASAQRAYFDDKVLFGPEYVYQKLYNGEHMNSITLDMSVYL